MYKYLQIGSFSVKGYDFFNNLGVVCFLVFCLLQYKRKVGVQSGLSVLLLNRVNDGKKKRKLSALLTTAESVLFWGTTIVFPSLGNTLWLKMLGDDAAANYFGQMLPGALFTAVFLCILRMDPLKNYDIFAPGFALELTFYKIACFCAGCCRGIEWEHGFFNEKTLMREFPVQLLESGTAFLIFVALMIYRRYNRHPGTVYPLYILLYSATRFVTEFWRGDAEPVLGRLVPYQLQCIGGVVIGAVVTGLVLRYGEKISSRFVYVPAVTDDKKKRAGEK